MRPPAKFCFISPDGTVFKGENVREFAAKHGLDPANMQHVHSGDRSHHKRWRADEGWYAQSEEAS